MRLPRLPNNFVKSRAHTVQFLGINLTENTQDGEMSDCKGLSTLQYPTLSQRKGREPLEGYDNVTDMYEWGGKLIIVSGGILYVDGAEIASVNDEPKQFAVVNTRLVVFPDKISVDLKNNELMELEATAKTTTALNAVTFTHNKLTAALESRVTSDVKIADLRNSGKSTFCPFFYSYGSSISNLRDAWNASTMSWDLTALESLKRTWAIGPNACYALQNTGTDAMAITAGQIIIPSLEGLNAYRLVRGDTKGRSITSSTEYPDTSQYNNRGYIGIVTSTGDDDYYASENQFKYTLKCDIYNVETGQVEFSELLKVGDMVDISGTLYGLLDTTHNGDDTTTSSKLKIVDIADNTETTDNALIFADNTFHVPTFANTVGSDQAVGDYYFRIIADGSYVYYKYAADVRLSSTQVLVMYSPGGADTETLYVWDREKHKIITTFAATKQESSVTTYRNLSAYNPSYYNSTRARVISISRSIPNLDFICERDNRLWGVSNNDKTIYCSALGIPWDFYDYSGLDTGAYAVAVGSAGDFTGIVSYGGVLCFKEDKVHKMLGSFPSDFYMTTYDVAGIAKDASKSAIVISEILYYRSPLGVMAFTGYQPTNISPNLALENTTGGVGGTNGREYFLCVRGKEGDDHYTLFKYDLQLKLWIKEEDVNVTSMANLGNDLYITTSTKQEVQVEGGGSQIVEVRTPYLTGQQNPEGMELDWFAQFVPYIETGGGVKQVGYTRLILRFDMAPGSRFKIKVRYDNGRWEDAWTQPATQKMTFTVPLRIRRCDKFELRLEGKGQTKVRSIQREFVRGGWFENGSGFY